MLREGVQSWRCSLKALGRKVAGEERGHPDTCGEQTPREGPGPWQARARENGFSGCRQAGLIRLSLSKESGSWLPTPGGRPSLTFLLLFRARMNLCRWKRARAASSQVLWFLQVQQRVRSPTSLPSIGNCRAWEH